MSYNAVTIPPSSAMSSPDASGLTPESNARDIAALTQALGMVVSQFVQPSVQQANANRETLDEVIELLSRHAQGLLSQEQRVDQLVGLLEGVRDIVAQNSQQIAETAQQQRVNSQQIAAIAQQQQANAQQIAQNSQQIAAVAQQQQANAQQIAQNTEAITAITQRLEQFDTRLEGTRQLVAKNSSDFARMNTEMKASIERLSTETKASIDRLVEENRAFRESQQSQLAAIIGNARRIDRLEQQAG